MDLALDVQAMSTDSEESDTTITEHNVVEERVESSGNFDIISSCEQSVNLYADEPYQMETTYVYKEDLEPPVEEVYDEMRHIDVIRVHVPPLECVEEQQQQSSDTTVGEEERGYDTDGSLFDVLSSGECVMQTEVHGAVQEVHVEGGVVEIQQLTHTQILNTDVEFQAELPSSSILTLLVFRRPSDTTCRQDRSWPTAARERYIIDC